MYRVGLVVVIKDSLPIVEAKMRQLLMINLFESIDDFLGISIGLEMLPQNLKKFGVD